MKIGRFLTEDEFRNSLGELRAYRGISFGPEMLERFERAGLLVPRVRLEYPHSVARRLWLEHQEPSTYRMNLPIEPDGEIWEAAVGLENALFKWRNVTVYGSLPHPFDDVSEKIRGFIQKGPPMAFKSRSERRLDVGNNVHKVLYDSRVMRDYYSSWQVLLAAELADAGINILIDIGDVEVIRVVEESIRCRRIPDNAACSFNLIPVHAARKFQDNQRALDALVWFAEERSRILSIIAMENGGVRFMHTRSDGERYDCVTQSLAIEAVHRFGVDFDGLTKMISFLSEYWMSWSRDGRPLIANAYKKFLGPAVVMALRVGNKTFPELRDLIGRGGGSFRPILDLVWPDWAEEERQRAHRTISSNLKKPERHTLVVSGEEIDEFLRFISSNGLEAFFWRLRSFESHALRGNEFALPGMKSDVQGMSVVVEHIVGALGANKTQLYDKFKQLWRDQKVLAMMKQGKVSELARKASLSDDWIALKCQIRALASEPGGAIVADLVMAHRIRGGVHGILPEDDHFELQELFVGLMRAAILTFNEVRKQK